MERLKGLLRLKKWYGPTGTTQQGNADCWTVEVVEPYCSFVILSRIEVPLFWTVPELNRMNSKIWAVVMVPCFWAIWNQYSWVVSRRALWFEPFRLVWPVALYSCVVWSWGVGCWVVWRLSWVVPLESWAVNDSSPVRVNSDFCYKYPWPPSLFFIRVLKRRSAAIFRAPSSSSSKLRDLQLLHQS